MIRSLAVAAALTATVGVAGCASPGHGPNRSGNTTSATPSCDAACQSIRAEEATQAPATDVSVDSQSEAAPTDASQPTVVALGQSATTADGVVTVYSVAFPYPAHGEAADIKDAGDDFAVADIKFCPTTSEVDVGNFQLSATDDRTFGFWNVQIGARDPNLPDSLMQPVVGRCTRGYLTFEVTHGEKLSFIAYVDSNEAATGWVIR